MSERTTIGGTVYEVVGSSSSNLLLKCNGTARIQWGNKLIDLIKNGKIASGDSSLNVSVVTDESEIKSKGIYILDTGKSLQLWIYNNGRAYNLTGTELYISANNKQEITVEQKETALENIGLCYRTKKDLDSAGLNNGIAYVLEDNTLYTITNGVINEFEAKLKTVTVEQESEQGEIINSSFKIVLSILDTEYLLLADSRITANCDIYIKNHAQLASENADEFNGYRLYCEGDTSYLDVDEINVRNGIKTLDCVEVTFSTLVSLITTSSLIPNKRYLITDYQNPWKLTKNSSFNNRPILVRALSNKSLYREGCLYENQDVVIHYDVTYQESVNVDGSSDSKKAKGKITWMKDDLNNEANFDFLDYKDALGNPLTTLHDFGDGIHKSIFPKGSRNNKVTIINPKGTVLTNGAVDDTNTSTFDIQASNCIMYDNNFECKGFTITSKCTKFFSNCAGTISNTTIDADITNSNFGDVTNCAVKASVINCKFKNISNCTINSGSITNCLCHSDINNYTFSTSNNPMLYNVDLRKYIYFNNSQLQVFSDSEQYFKRGMIIMHSGFEDPPEGWAPCDGGTYLYNGENVVTPDLRGRFIKSVTSDDNPGPSENLDVDANNEFIITEEHLPAHSHPHKGHTHTISGTSVSIQSSGSLSMSGSYTDTTTATSANLTTALVTVTGEGVTSESANVANGVSESSSSASKNITVSGGSHSHTATVTEGTISNTTSEENTKTWTNKAFKIEPNYYSLIFIMKL